MSKQKIRIGIELNHVIRDINRQIVTYYQKEYDNFIDLDSVNYKCDVLKHICTFDNPEQFKSFMYEDYVLEIFGHAKTMGRNTASIFNNWLQVLAENPEYDIEVFLFAPSEGNLTIQSTYFFLSSRGIRSRKIVFPKRWKELEEMGDVFITASPETAKHLKNTILIEMDFNRNACKASEYVYDSIESFIGDDDNLNKILKLTKKWKEEKGIFSTLMRYVTSFSIAKLIAQLTLKFSKNSSLMGKMK